MAEKLVHWLEDIGIEHNDLAGKKCANLGEMIRIGMGVPQGFCILIRAQERFLRETGAKLEVVKRLERFGGKVKGLKAYLDASKGLRQIVESKKMPEDIQDEITTYYASLCQRRGTEVAVSVRSAGPVSHPGQYETYLNIRGQSRVLAAIVKVWSSIYNTATLAALDRQDLPVETSPPIGVCVLEMVNAESAGVCFTCDPVSGDPSKIIIEASWGLGESVVSGALIPDKYVVEKVTSEIREKVIGDKKTRIVSASDGTTEQEMPADRQSVLCLKDVEVVRIAELAKVLEAHFGTPQDVEWAISADFAFPDNVFLLQTRPVAGLNPSIARVQGPADSRHQG